MSEINALSVKKKMQKMQNVLWKTFPPATCWCLCYLFFIFKE